MYTPQFSFNDDVKRPETNFKFVLIQLFHSGNKNLIGLPRVYLFYVFFYLFYNGTPV